MEPRIQYATASDGARIACFAAGTGPALLSMQTPYSHLAVETSTERWREYKMLTDNVRTSAAASFEERDERELKGVSEPVRLWACR